MPQHGGSYGVCLQGILDKVDIRSMEKPNDGTVG